MYDVGGLINYETKSNATTAGADVATNDSIGSEFRRLRFTIKVKLEMDGVLHSNLTLLMEQMILMICK